MSAENLFDEIALLRKRSTPTNLIQVFHAGYQWDASFEWFLPASVKEVSVAEKDLGISFPKDYVTFLTTVSDGSILFCDAKHGQWGFRIYRLSDLSEKQVFWKSCLEEKWTSSLLAFGECIGDPNALVFDRNRPSKNRDSFAVMETDMYDHPEAWVVMSRSFHEWLDHLVTAQGDKYWLWR